MRPRITVITTTYCPNTPEGEKRAEIATKCVRSWSWHLHYQGEMVLHVADDGSELLRYCELPATRPFKGWAGDVSFSRQERKGVGASLNAGFEEAFSHSPLAMYIVDDWLLEEDIDLTPWADLLMGWEGIGMVRLGPPHPGISGMVLNLPAGWALELERHNFAFAMRPALYHKRFMAAYGRFEEMQSAVECERMFNVHFCDSRTGPEILHAIFSPWSHQRVLDLGEVAP